MGFVNVLLRCRCGDERTWCVPIHRNVPAPLRCAPSIGGGGLTAIRCTRGHECFESVRDFERAVEVAAARGWGRWQQVGAVVVEC